MENSEKTPEKAAEAVSTKLYRSIRTHKKINNNFPVILNGKLIILGVQNLVHYSTEHWIKLHGPPVMVDIPVLV